MTAARYRLLDLVIDVPRQRVTREGVPLDVQGLSFRLLACLLRHGVDVVDFDALMAEVWAPAVVNEETVTQRVKLLRQSLGDDGRSPRYIRSVRGRGYQLCEMPVVEADDVPRASVSRRWIAATAVAVVLVVAAVAWRLAPGPAAKPSATQELVQRASYYASIGQRDNNERAIALYQQALSASPADREARIGLSRAYSARVCLYNFPYPWAQQAQTLAEAAVAAEPSSAPAWSALGYARDCLGDIDAAIEAYEKALTLAPGDDATRASAAYLYQERGRIDEALHANLDMHGDPSRIRFRDVQIAREMALLGFDEEAGKRLARSFQLYPDNVFSNIAWPRHLFLHGRLVEAQQALDEAMARNTPHVELYVLQGELALLRDDRDAALAAFVHAQQLRPQMGLPGTLVGLYGPNAPDASWFATRIGAIHDEAAHHTLYPVEWLELAMLLQAQGQRDAALDAVQTAVSKGYSDSAYLQVSPLLKPLSHEPKFAAAIAAINQRVAEQRQRVLAAAWCPPELRQAPR
ncbi:DNA-binding winged helix-turn-helix (wHTH) domain-containing protein [Dyella jiangningensis]|uniref:winged helix-turn-helix transcriptional regulator n=1 Tax=Dyella sp. AtDHG13 TaxID=1938897 RepID=UPI00088B21DB|nr:winged helix-turn-helix transcriptional regulator [Dyella sp. AtDHG13]PXV56900.1 DNA-binding winged helix-turn-helix (wHTH) protein [Dyella sp. AtDHG13]SDK60318.1 DNA-binding winged helix-turn-helix (wHTH) domain-containing protein [Dyella jiangningensis]